MVRISRQRSGVLDSQRLGQRIVYATGGNIQICMHGYNGNICLDQSSQQMPQIAVRPQGLQLLLMPADIHQRMVRNDQLTALFLCLGYNCLRNVKSIVRSAVRQMALENGFPEDAEREELTTRFLTIAAGGVLEGWLRGELTQTPEELTRQVDEIVQDYIRGVALRLKEPATTRR